MVLIFLNIFEPLLHRYQKQLGSLLDWTRMIYYVSCSKMIEGCLVKFCASVFLYKQGGVLNKAIK
ncbi:unknown protein [Parachlamydia acanthamoebae UV-7]|uniref:Uncharacterized protein n=2 Tax=Parachlamydia acanthamoebae TaxID=83552 RepID=F8KYH2_PARAV|nr:hypothetical protein DB43_EF00060 [Parachlamydia acanthamoebae]CCB85919.1 unknown protein [Parachlamydia acanthamoebae UV-7]